MAKRQAGVDRDWRARPVRRLTLSVLARALLLYFLGGLALIAWTSGLGTLASWQAWWDEPVVYQKLVCWTMLLELLGLAGTWVPLCGGSRPAYQVVGSWLRRGTVRIAPWPRKPKFQDPDTRTLLDVALYLALVVALALAVILPGVPDEHLLVARPQSVGGLVGPGVLLGVVVLTFFLGLRDKIVFMAARAELLIPAVVLSVLLGFTDLVIALKLTVVVVWLGTGALRLGRRLAELAAGRTRRVPAAELVGTALELAVPLALVLATDPTVVLVAVGVMLAFHVYTAAAHGRAVPLELHLFFAFGAVVLFLGYPADDGYAVLDLSQPWMLPFFVLALAILPVLGHLRPHLVSFLPSLRSPAGIGPSSLWVMAPGVERRLAQACTADPLAATAEVRIAGPAGAGAHKALAWRALQSQGCGLRSVLARELGPDLGTVTVREAGPLCSALMGLVPEAGHLHDEALVAALQRRLAFEPGELRVIVAEAPSVQRRTQQYRVVDAALGVLRRGRWEVADAVAHDPGRGDGPIPVEVIWALPDQPKRLWMRHP
ncbi:DUF3556 domain-containing protein [Marmoricola sp. RAF53]|uniref:DUF3556 domain-containing protein n=1 Tax=Marmoricola sp. RAF53 TaxID=3233059 RepID=UPI003F9C2E13